MGQLKAKGLQQALRRGEYDPNKWHALGLLARPALVEILVDRDLPVEARSKAVQILVEAELLPTAADIKEHLHELLLGPDVTPGAVLWSARALAFAYREDGLKDIPKLRALFDHSEDTVREAAIAGVEAFLPFNRDEAELARGINKDLMQLIQENSATPPAMRALLTLKPRFDRNFMRNTVPRLRQQLADGERPARIAAAELLKESYPRNRDDSEGVFHTNRDVTVGLRALLSADDQDAKVTGLTLLATILHWGTGLVREIEDCLDSEVPSIRKAAIEPLALLYQHQTESHTRITGRLKGVLLGDSELNSRAIAARALLLDCGESGKAAVTEVLHTADPKSRVAAIAGVFAYVGMGGTRAAPEDRLLSAIFGDNKELDLQLDEVIDGLATAAGSGDQAVVWQLLGKVNDTNSLHRATRIFLAQLSQHEALMAHITQFADDEFPDTSIQDAARQALNKLSGSL